MIQNSRNTITAPAQQTVGGTTYDWQSWSDAGARSHDIFAPATATTYTATYTAAPPPADVRVTQSATLTRSGVTITAVVTNGGPGSASAVTLSDTLNSKLSYVSSSTTVGACAYASGSRTVTCSIGTLANAAQATVTIVANAAGHGNVSNVVTVTSTTTDPNTANNTATASIKLR